MIILDTNVISELMQTAPNPTVAGWLSRYGNEGLYTTAITKAEVLAGIALLPEGKRRRELESSANRAFARALITDILPFD
jgi:toxin FitB